MRRVFILALAGWLMIGGTASFATEVPRTDLGESSQVGTEVIVQIYGRMCEYHRKDVEGALRTFNGVRQVDFLNDHGTVLVQYQPGSEMPEQLAGMVHRALAAGWNCSARVDRGQHAAITHTLEGRP
jgi:copper chaperone CopZ